MQVQSEKRPPMTNNPFGSFIELVSLDQEMRALTDHIQTAKAESDTLFSQKKELIERLDQFKKHVHDLKKLVHDQELEIKTFDAQEKKKKEQFDSLKDTKQYPSLKKEIDRLKQAQHDAEKQLMIVWNKLEIAQKELEEQQLHYNTKISEIDSAILKKNEETALFDQKLGKKHDERPAKESAVPEEWLEKYTHMRMRVANPVIEVINGNCNACFYNLPAHEVMRLKRRALLQCKGCFRLLYLKEAMEQSSPE